MLNLSPEQNALFAILRNEKVNNETSVDWDEVRKEAFSQAVFLMLAKSDCLPEDVVKAWKQTFHTAMRNNIQAFYAITEMDRVMRSIIIRRLYRTLTGKRVPVTHYMRFVDERKSVYDQLHLFEV